MSVARIDIGALLAANRLVLAPLAGWTDLPFRLLTKPFGPGLVFTEMISAEGLVRRDPKTWALLRSHPAEAPVGVQLFGHRPDRLAEAARLVEAAGFGLIDLNMGCPVPKVIKQGAGAALSRDVERAIEIMSAVRRAVETAVTAKIRSGWSTDEGITAVDLARRAEETGLDGLTIHPRFARQGFGGRADYRVIARVAAAVGIPVIGSGDVRDSDSARRMAETGCQGTMIGRAALGDPWIFRRLAHPDDPAARPDPEARRRVIERHLALLEHYHGPIGAWLRFKGLSGHYLRGLPGAKAIRVAVHASRDLAGLRAALNDYFDGLPDPAAGEGIRE